MVEAHFHTKELTALFGDIAVIRSVDLTFQPNTVTAVIGASGSGKSTLLRCLNRMHELSPGARVEGSVCLDGEDIYRPEIDPVTLRKRIGMVLQHPTPFPIMSIFDNVAAGLRINGRYARSELEDRVEHALRSAALWDEVKDRLDGGAMALSGGQQQRLCIARAIAPRPEALLLDEPTSALDPIATHRIEELVQNLKTEFTVVIVTHSMQQAARISDYTAFLHLGNLIEVGNTQDIFTNPSDPQTEAYITGRFG